MGQVGQTGQTDQVFSKASLREQLRKTMSARLLLHAAMAYGDVNDWPVLRGACVGVGMVQVAVPQPRKNSRKKKR